MTRFRWARIPALLSFLVAGLWGLAIPVTSVSAATVAVCPTTQAELTSAISAAGVGGIVQINCDTTITLASTIVLGSDVIIDGTGYNVTISGNNSVRVFTVNTGADVTLKHLSIINGTPASGDGGGISSAGSLTVMDSTFSGNSAFFGGGISSSGSLSVATSAFRDNSAKVGGGIFSFASLLSVTGSTFSGNDAASEGGGITTRIGSLSVSDSTFDHNSAHNVGGGIAIGDSSTVTITSSLFSNNTNLVAGFQTPGGGISNGGTLSIADSTLSGNAASHGGGIYNAGVLTVTDSTLSANSATIVGGGIATRSFAPGMGTVMMTGSILSGNTAGSSGYGGGVYIFGGASLAVANSTLELSGIGGNCGGASPDDLGGNQDDDGTCGFVTADTTPPEITYQLDPATPSGSNGWYSGDVDIDWTVTDAESAATIDSGCTDQSISSDTPATGLTLDCSAHSAGGSASESVTLYRDATAPDVSVTGVSDGATYVLGSVPAVGCVTTDATSGVAADAVLSTSGGPVGSITVRCDGALDNTGNAGAASVTYSVVYDWSGFVGPIEELPTLNAVKAGAAVPVIFSLAGDQGLTAVQSVTSVQIECAATAPIADVEETASAGNSGLQYDPETDQYSYVWKTDKTWANTCRQLQLTLADGTTHLSNFKFR